MPTPHGIPLKNGPGEPTKGADQSRNDMSRGPGSGELPRPGRQTARIRSRKPAQAAGGSSGAPQSAVPARPGRPRPADAHPTPLGRLMRGPGLGGRRRRTRRDARWPDRRPGDGRPLQTGDLRGHRLTVRTDSTAWATQLRAAGPRPWWPAQRRTRRRHCHRVKVLGPNARWRKGHAPTAAAAARATPTAERRGLRARGAICGASRTVWGPTDPPVRPADTALMGPLRASFRSGSVPRPGLVLRFGGR